MMMQSETKDYTPEAYLTLEETAQERHEDLDGEIVPMAGAMRNPNQIALRTCLRSRSLLVEPL